MKKGAIIISLLILTVLISTNTDVVSTESGGSFSEDKQTIYLPLVNKSGDEHHSLMALYYSTNGPNWIFNTGWGFGDPCDISWHGVFCDSTHEVQSILLNYNNLIGSIPAELGTLRSLTGINLVGNQLSGSLPAELGNLVSLEGLYLTDNQLSGPIPTEFGNLSNLKELILVDNQLSGSIPSELGNLSRLQVLYLEDNQLSGLIPAELGNLSHLRWLILFNNNLTGSIPAELSNLNGLKKLYLDWFLLCWQTEEALTWATGLPEYSGPYDVCP